MRRSDRHRLAASVVILLLAGFMLFWQSGALSARSPAPAGTTDPNELEQRNRHADPSTNPGQLQGLVRDIF